MRIVLAILWGILGIVFGAVDGAAFGWVLAWPASGLPDALQQSNVNATAFGWILTWLLLPGVQFGAVLGGGVGVIYGLLPPRNVWGRSLQGKTKFNVEYCAWCKGFGVEGKSRRQQCRVCNGHGRVLVEQPVRKCSRCKGNGRTFMRRRRCQNCNGAGWADYALLDKADILKWG